MGYKCQYREDFRTVLEGIWFLQSPWDCERGWESWKGMKCWKDTQEL